MKDPATEVERLAEALARVATALTEIIEARLITPSKLPPSPQVHPLPAESPRLESERWADKKELARHFQVSVRTIHNWMERRLVPYFRTGRNVRFKISDVEAALNRKTGGAVRW